MSPATDRHRESHVEPTPLHRALALVGDRWTLALVDALRSAPARFGDLEQAVPGIASNVLSARLNDLERGGLLTKAPYSTRPARFAYQLTERGHDLAVVLASLTTWGATLSGSSEGEVHHDACGTAVEWRAFCPTCERVVDGEASELAWA